MLCGIRQGCSFPPSAFVLAVKILAIEIRNGSMVCIETPDLGGEWAQKSKLYNWLTTLPQFLKIYRDMNNSFTILKESEAFTGLKRNVLKQKHYKYVLRENMKLFSTRL